MRFLALATALVTTIDPYTSAQAIELMMKEQNFPEDETPSIPHLRDLMGSLEARAEQCNFSKSVLQYQLIVANQLRSILAEDRGLLVESTPTPEVIAKLVDVLRKVQRVGDADITGATITVGEGAPWVIAFVTWCLGVPPSIYFEQEPFLEQNNVASRINIIIAKDDVGRPAVAIIHHKVEDITQLLGPYDGSLLDYMLSIDDYIHWLLLDLGFRRFDDEDFNQRQARLLGEVLGFAIPRIFSAIKCGKFGRIGQPPTPGRWVPPSKSPAKDFYLSPLPSPEVIKKSCDKFLQEFKVDVSLDFASPKSKKAVADLPMVRDHLEELGEQCECNKCSHGAALYGFFVATEEWCSKKGFYRSLSFLILDIFAFSLFNCNSSVLVRRTQSRDADTWSFQERIRKVLYGTPLPDPIDATTPLLHWTRSLVGHERGNTKEHLIMTSARGQVVYPAIFESFELHKQGYFQLCALPGTLRLKGLPYDTVLSPVGFSQRRGDDLEVPLDTIVSELKNLLGAFEFSWHVTPQDGKEIHAEMMLQDQGGERVFKQNPMKLFDALSNTLYVENCTHSSDEKLVPQDDECSYTVPWASMGGNLTGSQVHAIPVAGCQELRIFFNCFS